MSQSSRRGADRRILETSFERGCQTYVTGGTVAKCRKTFVQEMAREFRERGVQSQVAVIDATQYGMEKPPQLAMVLASGSAG